MLSKAEIEDIVALAQQAGIAIMALFRNHNFRSFSKKDQSPVTTADLASEEIILKGLKALRPNDLLISEEQQYDRPRPSDQTIQGDFWLIDPLDGTREFVAGREEFTVNIGWIQQGQPRWGVIYVPAQNTSYFVGEDGRAYRQNSSSREVIQLSSQLHQPIRAACSRSHRDPREFLSDAMKAQFEMLACGSSLKFCKVAEGSVDLYARKSPTCEWDTAAGEAIVRAAGGEMWTQGRKVLTYGKPHWRQPGFIAAHPQHIASLSQQLGF